MQMKCCRLSALGSRGQTEGQRDGKSFVCAGIYIIALQWLAFGLPPPVNAMTNRLKVPQRTPRTRHVLLLFPIQFWGGAAAGKKTITITCNMQIKPRNVEECLAIGTRNQDLERALGGRLACGFCRLNIWHKQSWDANCSHCLLLVLVLPSSSSHSSSNSCLYPFFWLVSNCWQSRKHWQNKLNIFGEIYFK